MIYANIPRAPHLCLSNLLAEDADNPNSRLVADLGAKRGLRSRPRHGPRRDGSSEGGDENNPLHAHILAGEQGEAIGKLPIPL